MITSDHDRRRHGYGADQPVDCEPSLRPVAVAEPADPRRQALECDTPRSELEPTLEERIVRKQRRQLPVDRRDIGRGSRQCHPPKRPYPATEQWPDVRRNEARI